MSLACFAASACVCAALLAAPAPIPALTRPLAADTNGIYGARPPSTPAPVGARAPPPASAGAPAPPTRFGPVAAPYCAAFGRRAPALPPATAGATPPATAGARPPAAPPTPPTTPGMASHPVIAPASPAAPSPQPDPPQQARSHAG